MTALSCVFYLLFQLDLKRPSTNPEGTRFQFAGTTVETVLKFAEFPTSCKNSGSHAPRQSLGTRNYSKTSCKNRPNILEFRPESMPPLKRIISTYLLGVHTHGWLFAAVYTKFCTKKTAQRCDESRDFSERSVGRSGEQECGPLHLIVRIVNVSFKYAKNIIVDNVKSTSGVL